MSDNEWVREEWAEDGYRPPSKPAAHIPPTAHGEFIERRVCPNCRLFFDVGVGSDQVFCSGACQDRHERGVFL